MESLTVSNVGATLIYLWMFVPSLILFFAMSRIASPKDAKVYWATLLVLLVALQIANQHLPIVARTIAAFFVQMLMPAVLTRGRPLRRIGLMCVLVIEMFIVEIVADLLWFAITATSEYNTELQLAYPRVTLLQCFVFATSLSVLYYLTYRLINRDGKWTEALPSGQQRHAGQNGNRSLLIFFALFIALQLALESFLLATGEGAHAAGWSFFALALGITAFYIASDIVLYMAHRRWEQQLVQEARAAVLAEQLVELAEQCAEFEQAVITSAKFRHDFRNQMQTISSLVDAGEYATACAQVNALADRLSTGSVDADD